MAALKVNSKYIIVASIDFGTTFSGYAFAFVRSDNAIRMNKNWGNELGHESFKTPMSVLLDSDEHFVAFGFEAEKKYRDLLTAKKINYELYRHFKMVLHNQKNVSHDTEVQTVGGKRCKALTIFTFALKYLKDHLLNAVSEKPKSVLPPETIKWVVTVPAIWSDESKSFMRLCAFEAGLIDSFESKQLLICLEPEAASTFCRRMDEDTMLLHKVGAKHMIIDAGGGTIDIAIHELLDDSCIKEIAPANGVGWGGTKVDENFLNLFTDVLGSDFCNRFQSECPLDWLDIRVNFERQKRVMDPEDEASFIAFPLTWSLAEKYKDHYKKDLVETLQQPCISGVRFRNGSIIFEKIAIDKIFNAVIDNILSHLKSTVTAEDIDLIILVGGFGECKYLQKALRNFFGISKPVFCPYEASVAVIKGAVQFGINPYTIRHRIARKTYGTDIGILFDPEKHPENRRFKSKAGDSCYVFQTFIKKGEEVNLKEFKSFVHRPVKSKQESMIKNIYCSDSVDVDYPDEEGVEKIGEIEIRIPDTKQGRNRRVEVAVFFGETELRVEGTELKDFGRGDYVETTLTFLTE